MSTMAEFIQHTRLEENPRKYSDARTKSLVRPVTNSMK